MLYGKSIPKKHLPKTNLPLNNPPKNQLKTFQKKSKAVLNTTPGILQKSPPKPQQNPAKIHQKNKKSKHPMLFPYNTAILQV